MEFQMVGFCGWAQLRYHDANGGKHTAGGVDPDDQELENSE